MTVPLANRCKSHVHFHFNTIHMQFNLKRIDIETICLEPAHARRDITSRLFRRDESFSHSQRQIEGTPVAILNHEHID
jgi:hypothetical protein